MIQNRESIEAILQNIKFQDWFFALLPAAEGWHLQVRFYAPDNDAPGAELIPQGGRKWYISRFATESEIVQTALKAVLTAMEHEVREQFTYKGRMLFGPHLDVNALLEIADRKVYREVA